MKTDMKTDMKNRQPENYLELHFVNKNENKNKNKSENWNDDREIYTLNREQSTMLLQCLIETNYTAIESYVRAQEVEANKLDEIDEYDYTEVSEEVREKALKYNPSYIANMLEIASVILRSDVVNKTLNTDHGIRTSEYAMKEIEYFTSLLNK